MSIVWKGSEIVEEARSVWDMGITRWMDQESVDSDMQQIWHFAHDVAARYFPAHDKLRVVVGIDGSPGPSVRRGTVIDIRIDASRSTADLAYDKLAARVSIVRVPPEMAADMERDRAAVIDRLLDVLLEAGRRFLSSHKLPSITGGEGEVLAVNALTPHRVYRIDLALGTKRVLDAVELPANFFSAFR